MTSRYPFGAALAAHKRGDAAWTGDGHAAAKHWGRKFAFTSKQSCAALAAHKGVELHDLVVGMPKLLEWLGRVFVSRDALLGAHICSRMIFIAIEHPAEQRLWMVDCSRDTAA